MSGFVPTITECKHCGEAIIKLTSNDNTQYFTIFENGLFIIVCESCYMKYINNEGEVRSMKKFKDFCLSDLKTNYLVEVIFGDETRICIVDVEKEGLCDTKTNDHFHLSDFNNDLTHKYRNDIYINRISKTSVMKVLKYIHEGTVYWDVERTEEEVRELTIEEIEQLLGYKVKIKYNNNTKIESELEILKKYVAKIISDKLNIPFSVVLSDTNIKDYITYWIRGYNDFYSYIQDLNKVFKLNCFFDIKSLYYNNTFNSLVNIIANEFLSFYRG